MLGYRSAAQIILIIVACVIIFTYIKPAFSSMKETQNETAQYQTVLESAKSYKSELQRLVNEADSFGASEIRALERYLPDKIDAIAVMRDIDIITKNNGLILDSVSAEEGGVSVSEADTAPVNEPVPNLNEDGIMEVGSSETVPAERGRDLFAQQFSASISGDYEQLKDLLRDLERNAYPLEVVDLSFSATEDDEYTFDLTLETYAFTNPNAKDDNVIDQF